MTWHALFLVQHMVATLWVVILFGFVVLLIFHRR